MESLQTFTRLGVVNAGGGIGSAKTEVFVNQDLIKEASATHKASDKQLSCAAAGTPWRNLRW